MTKKAILAVTASVMLAFGASAPVQAQQGQLSFFITSIGLGKGGDLGGVEGADRQCQSLAQAAGAGSKTWRAYLSTQGAESCAVPAVRRPSASSERIGASEVLFPEDPHL